MGQGSEQMPHQRSWQISIWKDIYHISSGNGKLKQQWWEFPGGLLIRIWCFHCCASGSVPGRGTEIPQATWHSRHKYVHTYIQWCTTIYLLEWLNSQAFSYLRIQQTCFFVFTQMSWKPYVHTNIWVLIMALDLIECMLFNFFLIFF